VVCLTKEYAVYAIYQSNKNSANKYLLPQLRDGTNATSPLIGKYCYADQLPMPVTTNSSAIYVHFVSDDSVALYGFRLEYITYGEYHKIN